MFQDFKVLDLTQGIAGPYAALLLADIGTNVIKAEPLNGDCARGWGPPFMGGESGIFLQLNRNKKSIALDTSSLEGKGILLKIASRTDIVLTDWPSAQLSETELSYEKLERQNPHCIYCHLSAFGEKGPLRDKPGAELVFQAMSDFTNTLGAPGDKPVRMGADVANQSAGAAAFFGVLAALYHRLRTGQGQKLDVSVFGSMMHLRGLLWSAISNPDDWYGLHCDAYTGPRAHGYRTKDGYIYFHLHRGSQEDFDLLLVDLGLEQFSADPRFADAGREAVGVGRYSAEVKEIWEQAFLNRTSSEVIGIIKNRNGNAVPVMGYEDVVVHPQYEQHGLFHQIAHPTAGKHGALVPMGKVLNRDLPVPPKAAPLLGEHTQEILLNMGYKSAEIKELNSKGVIKWTTPT